MVDLSMSQARMQLETLVRRAADDHERTTITEHGQPAAVLVNAEELADLDEAVALAEYRARQASGQQRMIPHTEALAQLARARPLPENPNTAVGSNPPPA